jgi:hypothetical protein
MVHRRRSHDPHFAFDHAESSPPSGEVTPFPIFGATLAGAPVQE